MSSAVSQTRLSDLSELLGRISLLAEQSTCDQSESIDPKHVRRITCRVWSMSSCSTTRWFSASVPNGSERGGSGQKNLRSTKNEFVERETLHTCFDKFSARSDWFAPLLSSVDFSRDDRSSSNVDPRSSCQSRSIPLQHSRLSHCNMDRMRRSHADPFYCSLAHAALVRVSMSTVRNEQALESMSRTGDYRSIDRLFDLSLDFVVVVRHLESFLGNQIIFPNKQRILRSIDLIEKKIGKRKLVNRPASSSWLSLLSKGQFLNQTAGGERSPSFDRRIDASLEGRKERKKEREKKREW